jgi:SAM-dependent methyltransferase
MSWSQIKKTYFDLSNALHDVDVLQESWATFVAEVNQHSTPYHLKLLVDKLQALPGNRDEIKILDHGCGGGITLLYLAAIGYTNIFGVDVETSNCERWNKLTSDILGYAEKRFFAYNGIHIPLDKNTINFVFSQQVLEHVNPSVFDSYFSEEARVMKRGGTFIHQIPHRLVPYDSHTKTWLLHCILPTRFWWKFIALSGNDGIYLKGHLFLRWPSDYKKKILEHFGNYQVTTEQRLRAVSNFEYYDGPVKLRHLVALFPKIPLVGTFLVSVISQFVMIEIIGKKH